MSREEAREFIKMLWGCAQCGEFLCDYTTGPEVAGVCNECGCEGVVTIEEAYDLALKQLTKENDSYD